MTRTSWHPCREVSARQASIREESTIVARNFAVGVYLKKNYAITLAARHLPPKTSTFETRSPWTVGCSLYAEIASQCTLEIGFVITATPKHPRYIQHAIRYITTCLFRDEGTCCSGGITHEVMSDMAYERIDWSPPRLYVAAASPSMRREIKHGLLVEFARNGAKVTFGSPRARPIGGSLPP